MTMDEFNEAAEIYDGFAHYDREAMVAMVGHLVRELIENGPLDRARFLKRLDRDIAADADTDDQISVRLQELKSFVSATIG